MFFLESSTFQRMSKMALDFHLPLLESGTNASPVSEEAMYQALPRVPPTSSTSGAAPSVHSILPEV